MTRVKALTIGCLAVAATAVIGQMSSTPQQPKPQKATQKSGAANMGRGQQVFAQNCYRCHQEPRGFSPSISGTVARHMRVRAGLSDEDYKALMNFLNP
jgi:mono/diheme cytochrome c family protein